MSVLIQPAAVRNVVEIRRGATPFCTRRLLICRHIDFSSPSRGSAAVAALGKAMQQRTARSSEQWACCLIPSRRSSDRRVSLE
jgi:endogenous inhibitor of DNA gyrase (YacG/DUF329 family)